MKFLTTIFSKLLFLIILFLTSCLQEPAKVINRKALNFSKSNKYNQDKYHKNAAEIVNIKQKKTSIQSKFNQDEISVKSGETLYSIAKNNNISLREIIDHNDLKPPYTIHAGDKIKIPYPNYHESREGDTLYSISRTYGMKVNDLIALNNLQFPYSIYPGDKIKIIQKNFKDHIHKNRNTSDKSKLASNKTYNTKTTDALPNKYNQFCWPVKGKIISKFGPKSAGMFNDGINISAKDGQNVIASEDGVVAYVGDELKGYGNLVIIKHADGWISAYAHLKNSWVKLGQKINKGEKIGAVGKSGKATYPQLYFGLRKGREAVNPENYLKS